MSETTLSSAVLFKWLWVKYLHKRISLTAGALVFMFIEGSMLGASAYLFQLMLDRFFVAGDSSMLFVVAADIITFVVRTFSGVTR